MLPKNVRNGMNLLLILSGICIAIAAMVGIFAHSRDGAIWFTCAGVALAIVAAFAWFQDTVWEHDRHKENALGPNPTANPAATLEFPKFSAAIEKYFFSFGGGGLVSSYSPEQLSTPQSPFEIGDLKPILVYTERGHFFVDVSLLTGDKGFEIGLRGNKLFGKPGSWDMNSNNSALEVVDDKGEPVFQFILKDESHIVLNGVFVIAGMATIATDHGTTFLTSPDNPIRKQIKPIFKYPAWKYPGQYE